MTALLLLRRFWWSIPIALLLTALLITRGTLADVKGERDRIRTAFDRTVANYRAAAAQAEASDKANTIRVGQEQAAISKDIADDYQSRIAALRADFAERVRRATGADKGGSAATGVPGLSDASRRADAAAGETQLPSKDALIASEQAEQLIALQAWVKRQATVDVSGTPD